MAKKREHILTVGALIKCLEAFDSTQLVLVRDDEGDLCPFYLRETPVWEVGRAENPSLPYYADEAIFGEITRQALSIVPSWGWLGDSGDSE